MWEMNPFWIVILQSQLEDIFLFTKLKLEFERLGNFASVVKRKFVKSFSSDLIEI